MNDCVKALPRPAYRLYRPHLCIEGTIGSIGPTEYSIRSPRVTARVTAGVTVERLPSVRDIVQSTKPHRPGISSLILTLELCSVALSFALPYMYISSAIGWVTAGHRGSPRGSPRLPSACFTPGAVVDCPRPLLTTPRTKSTIDFLLS